MNGLGNIISGGSLTDNFINFEFDTCDVYISNLTVIDNNNCHHTHFRFCYCLL